LDEYIERKLDPPGSKKYRTPVGRPAVSFKAKTRKREIESKVRGDNATSMLIINSI
jgi:hypothetical protein